MTAQKSVDYNAVSTCHLAFLSTADVHVNTLEYDMMFVHTGTFRLDSVSKEAFTFVLKNSASRRSDRVRFGISLNQPLKNNS